MAKLYFYFSAMNAGKTTVLLQSNYNYIERGMHTILFTSNIDTRYGVGKVTSRIGIQANAHVVYEDTNIFDAAKEIMNKKVNNINCILVDEAQFLSKKQIQELSKIVDILDIPVLAYGLRTKHDGELFEGSKYLLAWADKLIEIKTICHCGKKAIMNMRIDENGNKVDTGSDIEIGGNDKYIATCRHHYNLGDSGVNKSVKQDSVKLDMANF